MFEIDDPLDAFAVHGGCGYLGIVITGVFHRTHGIFYGIFSNYKKKLKK